MLPELSSLSEPERGPDSASGVVGAVLSSRSSWMGVRETPPPYLPNYDEASEIRVDNAIQSFDRLRPSHLITGGAKRIRQLVKEILTLSNCLQANSSNRVTGRRPTTGLDIVFTDDSIISAPY